MHSLAVVAVASIVDVFVRIFSRTGNVSRPLPVLERPFSWRPPRGFLEDGQSLEPIAFVGSFEKRTVTFVVLNTGDGDVKDASAEQVRRTAHREDADFVFTIMEAWGLPPDKVGKYQAILERYGSIAASPHAVDVVSFALETHHGSWVAQAPVKPKGVSKRKKTFKEPRFRFFSETAGRFAELLPQKVDGGARGAGVH